eukprot:11172021-Lingulodinium_polyedra.AAC.1
MILRFAFFRGRRALPQTAKPFKRCLCIFAARGPESPGVAKPWCYRERTWPRGPNDLSLCR